MDDLTITRLCAEAMGIRVDSEGIYNGKAATFEINGADALAYHPLGSDEQAVELVKKFRLNIHTLNGDIGDQQSVDYWEVDRYDLDAVIDMDLNRAICECVAKMQRAAVAPSQA